MTDYSGPERRKADQRIEAVEKALSAQSALLARIDERLKSFVDTQAQNSSQFETLYRRFSDRDAKAAEHKIEIERRFAQLEASVAKEQGATQLHRTIFTGVIGTFIAAVLAGVGYLLVGD